MYSDVINGFETLCRIV